MLEQFLIGLGFVLIFTPVLILLTELFKLYDHPNQWRINSKPIPTAGGLAIYASFFVAAYILSPVNLLPYFIGGTIVVITGLIDDYYDLSAGVKFCGQVAAVIAFLLLNPSSNYVITAIWMLSVINIINFIDGLDGLATGVVIIASIALFMWIYELGIGSSSLILILLGTLIGFLAFNFNPAKIFLGDTGAMFLGFLYAAIASNTVLSGNIFTSLLLLVLILAVPVLDAFCAIVRRLQKGVPVYQKDCQHFHHRLLDLGLSQRQVALCGYMLTIASSVLALYLVKSNGWNIYIILPLFVAVFLFGASKIGMIKPFIVKSQRRVL